MKRLVFLFCLLVLAISPALAAAPQFSPRQDTATGFQHLTGLVTADFNGDGRPDIAVTDDYAKRVVVYLTTASGTLGAPISTTLQFSAIGAGELVAGDFNEDGKQDLIVGTIAGIQASIVLLGNGDGSFTQGTTIPGSSGFTTAVALDINHDSHLDLITGGNPGFNVYLGDGHGGFTQQTFTNQGTADLVTAIAAADFNLDHNIDFVANGYTTNFLRFYAGAGTGSFSSPVNLPQTTIYSANTVNTADFNGDGKPDLLVGSSDIASVIFGNGDGSFQLGSSQVIVLATPLPPRGTTLGTVVAATADVNGDGIPDAVAIDSTTNTLNVFLNDGTGRFPQSAPDYSTTIASGSGTVVLADLNGDGLPDIIVGNYLTENVSVFLSIRPKTTPSVTLTASSNFQLVGTSLTFIAKVTGAANLPATGSVTLLDGTTSIGQQTLNANGQASFATASLSTAVHPLTLTYVGDANYLPVTSSALSQSVTDFQVALPITSQSVSRGASATYTLNLTPLNGFTGSVVFTCSGLPTTSTCVTNPAALNAQPASVTVSVTTTPSSSLVRSPSSAGSGHSIILGTVCLILSLLLRRRKLPHLATIFLMITALGAIAGCGNSSQSSSPLNPGSPSGSTAFTITGTTTQGAQTATHQVSATLVVN